MLTSNVEAEAQHVLSVLNDLSQKKALPDALVHDVGGTPKRPWHHARASGFSPADFSPGTRVQTAFERGAAQILQDGVACVNKKNEFLGTVCTLIL